MFTSGTRFVLSLNNLSETPDLTPGFLILNSGGIRDCRMRDPGLIPYGLVSLFSFFKALSTVCINAWLSRDIKRSIMWWLIFESLPQPQHPLSPSTYMHTQSIILITTPQIWVQKVRESLSIECLWHLSSSHHNHGENRFNSTASSPFVTSHTQLVGARDYSNLGPRGWVEMKTDYSSESTQWIEAFNHWLCQLEHSNPIS